MKKIRAIHNNILFRFDQDIVKHTDGKTVSTVFKEQTSWGFEFKNFQESTEQPRWGTVVVVGPDVDPIIQPGTRILIENLKWTHGMVFNGSKLWKTDESVVLAYNNA